jgi:hypothetical protein
MYMRLYSVSVRIYFMFGAKRLDFMYIMTMGKVFWIIFTEIYIVCQGIYGWRPIHHSGGDRHTLSHQVVKCNWPNPRVTTL